ncbi:MAG: hypothetical protein Faunusvirus4_23 [Faunusvirus sp.]|jgi:hypothetical protein|uniref:Uncharacterized protein n=1 Tax=Faunusvirus sp. TaxID=2487766 RepID=A0A3G4ZW90_9VIRU|nr:MAG: hypothetical protein Faunusvirus4_23 [Faunusvirus sp.]
MSLPNYNSISKNTEITVKRADTLKLIFNEFIKLQNQLVQENKILTDESIKNLEIYLDKITETENAIINLLKTGDSKSAAYSRAVETLYKREDKMLLLADEIIKYLHKMVADKVIQLNTAKFDKFQKQLREFRDTRVADVKVDAKVDIPAVDEDFGKQERAVSEQLKTVDDKKQSISAALTHDKEQLVAINTNLADIADKIAAAKQKYQVESDKLVQQQQAVKEAKQHLDDLQKTESTSTADIKAVSDKVDSEASELVTSEAEEKEIVKKWNEYLSKKNKRSKDIAPKSQDLIAAIANREKTADTETEHEPTTEDLSAELRGILSTVTQQSDSLKGHVDKMKINTQLVPLISSHDTPTVDKKPDEVKPSQEMHKAFPERFNPDGKINNFSDGVKHIEYVKYTGHEGHVGDVLDLNPPEELIVTETASEFR